MPKSALKPIQDVPDVTVDEPFDEFEDDEEESEMSQEGHDKQENIE